MIADFSRAAFPFVAMGLAFAVAAAFFLNKTDKK